MQTVQVSVDEPSGAVADERPLPVWLNDTEAVVIARLAAPASIGPREAFRSASPDGTVLRNPNARLAGHDFPRTATTTPPLNRRVRRNQARFWRSAEGLAAQRLLKRALRKDVDVDA